MKKKSFWQNYSLWEEAEKEWDAGAETAERHHPIKNKVKTPKVPLILPSTRKYLQLRTFWYLFSSFRGRRIIGFFFQYPLTHTWRFLKKLLFRKKAFVQKGDFLFFGCQSVEEFRKEIEKPESLIVIGFSYCQKPLECPSGRFNSSCRADPLHPVCRQCPIGKAMHALPKDKIISTVIPTFYDIAERLIDIMKKNPKRNIIFLITACGLSLEMFAQYPQIIGLKGIGVTLKGRFCNTFKTFELAERGIKPGLTLLEKPTMKEFMYLIKILRESL